MTQTEKQQQWENRIAEYRASGQSVRQWCASNDVKPERMWYWLRKYKTNGDTFSPSSQWLPVEVCEHLPVDQNSALMLRVGKACIEVKPGFDPSLLVQVVRALTG